MIDHKYGKAETRKEIEERNGQKISVKIKTQKCSRCGYEKEDRIRTIIENGDSDTEKSEPVDKNKKVQSNKDSSKESTFKKPNKSNNLSPKDISNTGGDEGVIILKNKKGNTDNIESNTRVEPRNVECESCDYTEVDEEHHRRTGDYCPECNGWLRIMNNT